MEAVKPHATVNSGTGCCHVAAHKAIATLKAQEEGFSQNPPIGPPQTPTHEGPGQGGMGETIQPGKMHWVLMTADRRTGSFEHLG